jgi:hypothetical protein
LTTEANDNFFPNINNIFGHMALNGDNINANAGSSSRRYIPLYAAYSIILSFLLLAFFLDVLLSAAYSIMLHFLLLAFF